MSGPTTKLPRGADQLLREFPVSEPDFEAQAKAIEARLRAKLDSAPYDDVLRAPELTPEPGEPASQGKTPGRSFTEMARRSVQRPTDDRSALVKELLAATSQARRPDAEMVARVRAAGRGATTTPLPGSASLSGTTPLPLGERPSGVVARPAPTAAPATPVNAKQPRRGLVLGMLGAGLAVAAAFALFVKSGSPELAPLESAPATPAAVVTASPATPAATPTKPSEGVVTSPEALAMAPEGAPREATGASPKAAPAAGAASPSLGKAQPASASPAKPSQITLRDDPKAESETSREPRPEPPEPQMKPAEGSTESVPLSPSGGAVSTALGAVRGGAQACLAGQSGSVTAVVTFASDGHVTSVTASGPSAACIQTALSKARLTPFAREHFSATTTIRPP